MFALGISTEVSTLMRRSCEIWSATFFKMQQFADDPSDNRSVRRKKASSDGVTTPWMLPPACPLKLHWECQGQGLAKLN